MAEKYSNSKDLEKLDAAIKAIDPNLKLGRFTVVEGKAVRAGLSVRVILEKPM